MLAQPSCGNGLAQPQRAGHGRILVQVGGDRIGGGLLDKLRSGEVGEALAKIDRAVLQRQRAHLGKNSRAEAGDSAGGR